MLHFIRRDGVLAFTTEKCLFIHNLKVKKLKKMNIKLVIKALVKFKTFFNIYIEKNEKWHQKMAQLMNKINKVIQVHKRKK